MGGVNVLHEGSQNDEVTGEAINGRGVMSIMDDSVEEKRWTAKLTLSLRFNG